MKLNIALFLLGIALANAAVAFCAPTQIPELVNSVSRAVEQATHDSIDAPAEAGLPKQRIAVKLSEEQQIKLLSSIADSEDVPERAEIVHSASRPDGHYFIRFPPNGDVFLIPAPDRSRRRDLKVLDVSQRLEVSRLDFSYRRRYDAGWADTARVKDRERRRPRPQSLVELPPPKPGHRRDLSSLNDQQKKELIAEWQRGYLRGKAARQPVDQASSDGGSGSRKHSSTARTETAPSLTSNVDSSRHALEADLSPVSTTTPRTRKKRSAVEHTGSEIPHGYYTVTFANRQTFLIPQRAREEKRILDALSKDHKKELKRIEERSIQRQRLKKSRLDDKVTKDVEQANDSFGASTFPSEVTRDAEESLSDSHSQPLQHGSSSDPQASRSLHSSLLSASTSTPSSRHASPPRSMNAGSPDWDELSDLDVPM